LGVAVTSCGSLGATSIERPLPKTMALFKYVGLASVDA